MYTRSLRHVVVLSVLMLCCSVSTILPAVEIQVPAEQPTIQAGLDAAVNGDTVTVADGLWTGAGNRDLVFNGKEVLLRSANGAALCTIDCQGSQATPHRAFSFESGEGPGSVVQGFTLTGGYADRGGRSSVTAPPPPSITV
jgi:hypothetical protein